MTVASFDSLGWWPAAARLDSPNWDERPVAGGPTLVVIHAISLPPEQFGGPGIFQLFTNTLDPAAHPYYAGIHQLRVSSHFLIRRDGEVIQFVSADKRAWHAGVSSWRGKERCNDFSIGIELEGSDSQYFEPAQYEALKSLLQAILQHYPIDACAGHSDIAPGRKTDPGPCFVWQSLRSAFPSITFPDLQKG